MEVTKTNGASALFFYYLMGEYRGNEMDALLTEILAS
jgi:hypothetical protein